MAIWKSLMSKAAQHGARKAMEKAKEPETRAQAKQAAQRASDEVKRSYAEVRGSDNPGRAAGQAVGRAFNKLKQGVDSGFDAPPRAWGGGDEDGKDGGSGSGTSKPKE